MNESSRDHSPSMPPAVVAIVGWVLPGSGYLLIGQQARGIVIGVTIITMFLSGILLAGVRVIDVPGYDRVGMEVKITPNGQRIESTTSDIHYPNFPWALTGRGFVGEIVNKPWYVCQILTGPMCLVSSMGSLSAARHSVPPAHARIYEIGTLYTAVAGLLNLLAIIDCGHRAGKTERNSEESP